MKRLREELELEAVPQAIEKRLRQVYAELPGEVPQTYLGSRMASEPGEWQEVEPVPVRRRPLRWLACAAGAVAVVCMLMVVLRLPTEETEILPGEASSEVEEAQSGYHLQVGEATCDGEYLYLTWEIQCPEEADKFIRIVPYGSMTKREWSAPGGFPQEDGFVLTADGERLNRDPLQSSITETPENGKLAYKYVYPLKDSLKGRSMLQVNLSLKEMYGLLSESDVGPTAERLAEIIPVNFEEDFTVTVGGSDYHLQVEDATCNEEMLEVTVKVVPPKDGAEYQSVRLGCYDETGASGHMPRAIVNGQECELSSVSCVSSESKPATDFTLNIPVTAQWGQMLDVIVQVDYLKIEFSEADIQTIPVNFKENLAVIVEDTTSADLSLREPHYTVDPGQDNGVSLLGVENTEEHIKLNLEVPVWGFELEEVLYCGDLKGTYTSCRLYTENGQELLQRYDLSDTWETEDAIYKLSKADKFQFTMAYEKRPAQVNTELPGDFTKVILRVFERSPDLRVANMPETWEDEYVPNLFAELTIDLETGEAVVTDTYRQEGIVKLDAEEYLNTPHTPDFTNGYFATEFNAYEGYDFEGKVELGEMVPYKRNCGLTVYADVDEPDIEVRFFKGETMVGSMKSAPREECEYVEEQTEDQEDWSFYRYESSQDGTTTRFILHDTDEYMNKDMYERMGYATAPQCYMSFFLEIVDEKPFSAEDLYYRDGMENWCDYAQLVDGKTGEVLIEHIDFNETGIWNPIKCRVGEEGWESQKQYEREQSEVSKAIETEQEKQKRYEKEQGEVSKALESAYGVQNG